MPMLALMSLTTAVMNPTSSMFSRPGRPQQPPFVFHARPSPSGYATTNFALSANWSQP
jgi:hypothetical protein